jgi:intracellular septation protein A
MGMGMIKFIRPLPQPLRSLYILAFVVLIFGMITFAFRPVELARWSIGIVACLIGLTVITNFRGATRGLAEGTKN